MCIDGRCGRFTLPVLAIGAVTIKYREGFELKSKTGLAIGTKEGMLDPDRNIEELIATCERLKIPFENVVSVEIEGTLLEPPQGLEELLNAEINLGMPITDGLEIVSKH